MKNKQNEKLKTVAYCLVTSAFSLTASSLINPVVPTGVQQFVAVVSLVAIVVMAFFDHFCKPVKASGNDGKKKADSKPPHRPPRPRRRRNKKSRRNRARKK